jgi:hypothetical protein
VLFISVLTMLQMDFVGQVSETALLAARQLATHPGGDLQAAFSALASSFAQAAQTRRPSATTAAGTTAIAADTTVNTGSNNTANGGAVGGIGRMPAAVAVAVAPVVAAAANNSSNANNSNAAAGAAVVPAPAMNVIDLAEVPCIIVLLTSLAQSSMNWQVRAPRSPVFCAQARVSIALWLSSKLSSFILYHMM